MTSQSLPVASPESQGLRAASVLRLIDELERGGLDPHALTIARAGQVLFRGAWQPWSLEAPSLVYSVSKTFTATAIGLLEADGLIDVEAPVDRYLGGDNPYGLTVRHLLTMNTGHSRDQTAALPFSIPAVLESPRDYAPGSHFAYNSPASYALSAIATAVGGRSLTDLLQERLFGPLGIGRRWWIPLDGIDQGFSGLHLDIDDMTRMGIALADGGRFGGRQVIPQSFIREATKPWSDTREPDDDGTGGDWSRGYGYQLWRSRHGYRLDGAYGQFVVVVPETGIVVAYQGSTTRAENTLEAIWRLIESFSDAAVDDSPADAAELAGRAASLDSWDARSLWEQSADAVPDAASWTLVDDADRPDRWELITDRGRIVVTADGWQRTVLTAADASGDNADATDADAARSIVVAARGENRGEGSTVVQLVVPTSPHRAIVTRKGNELRATWHTTPLWHPSIETLAVPDRLAHRHAH